MQVNIYIHSTIKTIRPSAGMGLYILATEIGDKEATLSGKVEFMKDPVKKCQFKKASNNVAHIICLMSAVERLTAKCDSLDIYTDSEWLGYRMEELGEMSQRDWKDSRGREYSGADYWQRINTVLEKYNLNPVIHVKEHHSFKKWFIEQEKLNG